MARPRKYPQELLDRCVRLALESERPIAHIAADLAINSEVLRKPVRQVEADEGLRKDLLTSGEREDVRRLRKENAELWLEANRSQTMDESATGSVNSIQAAGAMVRASTSSRHCRRMLHGELGAAAFEGVG
jgi:transposase